MNNKIFDNSSFKFWKFKGNHLKNIWIISWKLTWPQQNLRVLALRCRIGVIRFRKWSNAHSIVQVVHTLGNCFVYYSSCSVMKEAEGSGDKKFPSDDDDHCALLTTYIHTWRAIFLHLLNPFFILVLLWVTWHTFWIGIGNMRIGQDLVCQKVKKNCYNIECFRLNSLRFLL